MNNVNLNQKNMNIGGNFTQSVDNNIYIESTVELEKSQIYSCLTIFSNSTTPVAEMDIEKIPAELNVKLSYNHAGKYINIFADRYLDIENIGKIIINDFPDGQTIISSLKTMFINSISDKDYNDDGSFTVNDGATLLDALYDQVKARITKDPRYDRNNLSVETVEKFVYAFLGYGVSECQVLLNPNG
ncbi:hypothetical protein ACLUXJ_09830 [Lactobacillus porci]|uniref:hypothetical protein n=1 Tax=Lactobacillus porci TaxID=2012477 RepID=UPI0039951E52